MKKGYTKHYYNGSQRLASVVGDISALPDSIAKDGEVSKATGYMNTFANLDTLINLQVDYEKNILQPVLKKEKPSQENYVLADNTYFYHADHLGSMSWITDGNGDLVEHRRYLPYGEEWYAKNFVEDRYTERFRFTGKERDQESGYDYFGARYLDAMLLTSWLSVDPLADNYPHLTPYHYAAGNPLKFIDDDGRKLVYSKSATAEFKQQVKVTFQFMRSKGTMGIFDKIAKHDGTIYLAPSKWHSAFKHREKTIYWDPKMGILTNKGIEMSPATVLNHEADHALQELENPSQKQIDRNLPDAQYHTAEERRVITGSEQETARKHGEIGNGEVTREDHWGQKYETTSPITTQGKNEVIITPKKTENE